MAQRARATRRTAVPTPRSRLTRHDEWPEACRVAGRHLRGLPSSLSSSPILSRSPSTPPPTTAVPRTRLTNASSAEAKMPSAPTSMPGRYAPRSTGASSHHSPGALTIRSGRDGAASHGRGGRVRRPCIENRISTIAAPRHRSSDSSQQSPRHCPAPSTATVPRTVRSRNRSVLPHAATIGPERGPQNLLGEARQ